MQWPWVTPNQCFKVTPVTVLLEGKYLKIDSLNFRQSYYRIENYRQTIEWYQLWTVCDLHFEQPLTRISRLQLVLLRLSKLVPKPWFFRNTVSKQNRDFMPLCWRFWKRSSSSVLTVRWTLNSPRVLSPRSKPRSPVVLRPRVWGEGKLWTSEWMEESGDCGRQTVVKRTVGD